MPVWKSPLGSAEKADQTIARFLSANGWARLACFACPIHLASSHASNADSRPFGAPDWSVAVPDRNRRAGECQASSDRLNGEYHFRSPDRALRLAAM
jgi:hypothetical protein